MSDVPELCQSVGATGAVMTSDIGISSEPSTRNYLNMPRLLFLTLGIY